MSSFSQLMKQVTKESNNKTEVLRMNVYDNSKSSSDNMTDTLLENLKKASYNRMGTKSFKDGLFINEAMKTGASDRMLNSGHFSMSMITFDRQLLMSTYHGCWIFRRIIDRGAQDLWSHGINILGSENPEATANVYRRFNKLKSELIYASQQSRLFGGSASLMMINDGESDLEKPLNLRNIKKNAKLRLYTVDRWHGVEPSVEKVTDFTSVDFNTPKYYKFTINSNNIKTMNVHHSRVLRFVNRRSPRIIESILNGWGVSELEHIMQDLMSHENTKNATASLLNKALLEIIKVNGLRGMMSGLSKSNPSSTANFAGRYSAINDFRSINNMVLLDTDDEFSNFEYSFSGLSELLQTQSDLIAGAAEMPRVLLYGDTKGGLTSDSPAEMEFYVQNVNASQEFNCRPNLDKILPILYRQEGVEISELDYEFEPISGLSIDKKTQLLNGTLDAVSKLIENGMITSETGLEEIKQIQRQTGFGSNLEERDYERARKQDEQEELLGDEDESLNSDDIDDSENDYKEITDDIVGKNKKWYDKIIRRK